MKLNARSAILLLASLCVADRAEAGHKAGSITYESLVPGGMAIGGVTSRVDGPTSLPGGRESMVRVFEQAMFYGRPDIPVMGADRVRAAVGDDTYESMLAQFKLTSEVSVSTLDSLRAALADSVRYLVVAGFEKERAFRYTNEIDTDYDPKTDNSETFNIGTRTIWVGFRVYDLQDGKLAWKVRQTDQKDQMAKVPEPTTLFSPKTVAGQLELALSDREDPDPGMPDVFWNLTETFNKFMRALPKRKK